VVPQGQYRHGVGVYTTLILKSRKIYMCVCVCARARACVCVFSCLGGVPLAHGPPINIKEALFRGKHSCKDNKLLLLALRTLRTIAF
jgi:hypothetical protein